MIRSNDIRTSTFSRAGRGYKIQDVDDLLEKAADSMEDLEKENSDLIDKLKVLADRIQEYRNDEDSIRSALLTAQKSADRILKDANAEKEQMVAEARQQSEEMVRISQEKSMTIANETREKVAKVLTEAKEKAAQLLLEAKDKSDRMLSEAVEGCKVEKQYLEFLKEQEKQFRNQLIDMYKEQFEILKRGPELLKELDVKLSQENEPIAVDEQVSEQTEDIDADIYDADDSVEFVEPEDIPLPIDAPEENNGEQNDETDDVVDQGFAIKRKFTDLKFGDDYDISADDDYDEV